MQYKTNVRYIYVVYAPLGRKRLDMNDILKGERPAQHLDIGAVIASKWGKQLPGFVIRLIERLIHQDEINDVLLRYKDLSGIDFMDALVKEFNLHIDVRHRERLPQDGRALFICNHPLGGIDGICLSQIVGRHYKSEVRYIVNDLLFHIEPLQNLFVPVNTLGKQTRGALDKLQEALSSELPVLTFPAGFCSRYIDGKVQDVEWKKSFIKMAIEHKRPIVPLFFEGLNSPRFYRTERLRRRLGIRFNIGLALLPDEMFRSRNHHYTIHVGHPISYEELTASTKKAKELTQELREIVYRLPQ